MKNPQKPFNLYKEFLVLVYQQVRMMKKINFFFLILSLLILSNFIVLNSATDDTPYFTLNFIVPDTMNSRILCVNVIKDELSKIGIEVTNHVLGYGEIGPRTWAYPFLDYNYIPVYEDGGFDGVFIGHYNPIDLDVTGMYETSGFPPSGDNYYQYSNPTYDSLLTQYQAEQNPTQRSNLAKQLQAILYEDLPAISLYYNKTLMAKTNTVSGIDEFLLYHASHRAENWDDNDHILKYAMNGFTGPPPSNYFSIFRDEYHFSKLWMQPIYGALFQRNAVTHFWEPVIASGYSISSDKLSITVDIDPNAKFSDGNDVLAEDVKYTYELLISSTVGSPQYWDLKNWFGSNDSFEILGPKSIKFTTTSVHNFPLSLLSYGIIDKSIVEPALTTYGLSLFDEVPLTGNVQDILLRSCGPFKLDIYDQFGFAVKLVPNIYWSDLAASGGVDAKLNELYFAGAFGKETALNELIIGTFDVMDSFYLYPPLNKTDLQGLSGISGVEIITNYQTELSINLKHPILGTGDLTPNGTIEAAKNVRKAISHSIPRVDFIDNYFDGIGSPGVTPIPEGCLGFDTSLSPYEYNLTLAEFYMKKSGYGVEETTDTKKSAFNGFSIFLITFLGISYLLFINNKRR